MILCFRKRFCCHAAGGGVCKFAVHTVRNGCSTCSGLLTTGRWWSASLNISDRVGSSRPQYPSCWHRLTSESSFAMSPAEHMPCHAGPAYVLILSDISSTDLQKRFGEWQEALESKGLKVNADKTEDSRASADHG